MTYAIWLILSVALSTAHSRPTTESTHSILQRLGFDPISKPVVNHHSKRVALETNKARYHNDVYNSDTDSHMFVVKLPPHTPYYSHVKPEKFENEVVTKPPMSFRTNGKPARVYHWNIPVIKKISSVKPLKSQNRKIQEDSKIYHVKITPNEKIYKKQKKESHKKYSKYKKHKMEEKNKYHENDVAMNDASASHRKNHILTIKELSEVGLHHIKAMEMHHQNEQPVAPEKHKKKQKQSEKYSNEILKGKEKDYLASFYHPALPKENSFHKYFPGNGKPKSFYVIEKNQKPSRYHRLL